MSRKKIAVLTMTSEPRLLLAGVDDGQVHIIKCDRLERSILSLKLTLPNKLKKLKEAGFVLLVDEVVPCFAKHGRAVRLSDTDAKGRPVIVSAMEAYNYLMGLGGITYPSNSGGMFEVSPSLVEEVRGTDGKATYNIDWTELRPETYALMLAIYAATQDSISDKATLTEFFEKLSGNKPISHQHRAFGLFKAIDEIKSNIERGAS